MSESEWITPKTDWGTGDYYTKEDGDRFVNNLTILRGLAVPCYYDSINLLIRRDDRSWATYYAIYNFNIYRDLNIYTTDYDIYRVFKYGLQTLFLLECLRQFGNPNTSRKYPLYYADENEYPFLCIDRVIGSSESSVKNKYTGWYLEYNKYWYTGGIPSDFLKYIWDEEFEFNTSWTITGGNIICPFTSYLNSGTTANVYISGSDNLANTPFISASGLNKIESTMASQYTYFTDIASRYPREDA